MKKDNSEVSTVTNDKEIEAEMIPKVLFHKVIHEPQKDIVVSIKTNGLIPQIVSEYKDLVPEEIRVKPIIWLASRLHSYTNAPVFLVQTKDLEMGKLYHVVDDDLDWWVYEGSIPADQIISLLGLSDEALTDIEMQLWWVWGEAELALATGEEVIEAAMCQIKMINIEQAGYRLPSTAELNPMGDIKPKRGKTYKMVEVEPSTAREAIDEQAKELVPEELEKARAYLSSIGYELDYEMVKKVIKAYLQARARSAGRNNYG